MNFSSLTLNLDKTVRYEFIRLFGLYSVISFLKCATGYSIPPGYDFESFQFISYISDTEVFSYKNINI